MAPTALIFERLLPLLTNEEVELPWFLECGPLKDEQTTTNFTLGCRKKFRHQSTLSLP